MDKNVKVYFFTSLFPNELEEEIYEQSRGAIANANNTLQWNFFKGLKFFHDSIFLYNFPNVGAYPNKYKKLFIPSSAMYLSGKLIGESFSFLNFIYIKHLVKLKKIEKVLNTLLTQHSNSDKLIFYIYDLYSPFLKAVSEFKRLNPDRNIHICLMIPDLLGKTGAKNDFIHNFFLNIDQNIFSKSIDIIDSFVLLSEQMSDLIAIDNKKRVVVEGIYNDIIEKNDFNKSEFKIIFYSGALDERNGVLNLLEAFKNISDDKYKLYLCGDGPLRDQIVSLANNDHRIEYKGQLRRESVLALQRESTLLINPRLPGQDFTKYSFPSKTMEYLASGVPVLMYKLEGIPDDYFEHCFYLEDTSIHALTEKILMICNTEEVELKELVIGAQRFIANNKNPRSQCEKIYNMVMEI